MLRDEAEQGQPAAGAALLLPDLVSRWLHPLVALTSAGVLGGWLLLAIAHLGDRFQIGHRQGVWMALAHHLNTEGLYPPIFDGVHYGGVRYMPVPFVLHGFVARLTGDYLVSGKLLALVAMAGLLVLVFLVLVRLGCSPAISLGLTATVIAGRAGLVGGTSFGADVLPVVFQVAAIALLWRRRTDGAAVAAGALCTLALVSRFNAFWAPLAIAVWLWRDRRRLLIFVGSFLGLAIASLALLHVLSDGRMYDNVFRFAAGGILSPANVATAPLRFLDELFSGGVSTWILVPIAAFGVLVHRRLEPSVFAWGLVFAVAIMVATFADIGTGFNQLLDVMVLVALVLGQAAASLRALGSKVFIQILAVALVWVSFTAVVVHMRPTLKEMPALLLGAETTYPADPLGEAVPREETVLFEDPGLPALRGQTPIVFDPFMLNRIDRLEPRLVDDLVKRIEQQEFDAVVLVEPLEENDEWWRDYHFGRRVVGALRGSYERDGIVGGFFVYRPIEVTS